MAASLFKTKIAAAKIVCKTLIAAAVLLFSGCERQIHAQSEFVLGTVCSINLYEDGSAELYGKLFARLRELNDIFNNYSDSSEISRVNQNAAAAPVKVSKDFYIVLKSALNFARLTGGAFDPT
ncbi:MAG: FAD:protein FMN transferase, partial [Treponema sp.]|nr:FAD:protein FMN transferase [Treponema sp.]